MNPKKSKEKIPDPDRIEALKSLPKDILDSMNKEEIRAFLHAHVWPDSLREKLKDYIEDPASPPR